MVGWNTLPFFATGADLSPILSSLEKEWPIRYVKTGLSADPELCEFSSFALLPDFGLAPSGDHNREAHYLIVPRMRTIRPRRVPQVAGGVRYAVDFLSGEGIAGIRCGGLYDASSLIDGLASTRSSPLAKSDPPVLAENGPPAFQ